MHKEHENVIRNHFELAIKKCGRPQLADSMFERFFHRYPEARTIFLRTDIADFSVTKFRVIREHIIDSIRRPQYASDNMYSEIHRHQYFDVNDAEYYYGLIDACREAVEEALADEWTPSNNNYWDDTVQAAKATIQQAIKDIV